MFQGVIQAVSPAVVLVECADLGSKGSGFVVTTSGHVITCNHVIASNSLVNGAVVTTYSSQIEVVSNGVRHPATLAMSPTDFPPVVFDYAILSVPGVAGGPALGLGTAAGLAPGTDVICLGYPLDFEELVVTTGVVSNVAQRPSHVNAIHQMRTIVSDAVVQFGSSGGPMVLAASGVAVGVVTLRHELRDPTGQRLRQWRNLLQQPMPAISDVIDFVMSYTFVGWHHAVSAEHVTADPAWLSLAGGAP